MKLQTKWKSAPYCRNRLAQMSRAFKEYSDKDVQMPMKKRTLSSRAAVIRQEEKQLRERRDYIERRIVILQEQIGKGNAYSPGIGRV
nr:hypothetical protein [Sinobaca sp. H24]